MKEIRILGLVAGITMPLWNIPLIIKIVRRRSCADISFLWLFGVWGSIVLMLPSSLLSSDVVLKGFGISNFLLFSVVVAVVLKYARPETNPDDTRSPDRVSGDRRLL